MENRYFHWSWYRVDYGSNRSFCSVMCVNIIKQKKKRWLGFLPTSLTIILLSASVFAGMFPRVLISSLGSIYDLTIYNAASGDYALKLMTYFSIAILPFVLGSQIWSFYVFRQPVKSDKDLEY